MRLLQQLSSDDARMLSKILSTLSERAKRTLSLEELLEDWKTFVSQVEEGYSGSIYDYTNDLSVRDLLDEIVSTLSTPVGSELNSIIEPVDQRFYHATGATDNPITSASNSENLQSWWFRIPRKLSPELDSDFRSEGLL